MYTLPKIKKGIQNLETLKKKYPTFSLGPIWNSMLFSFRFHVTGFHAILY